MFRSSDNEFLLCYNGNARSPRHPAPSFLNVLPAEFGLYVNRHGDPIRNKSPVEWEGTIEHVAWHSPYILLFDARFIEVRHVETGRLCQIIPGNDMRCIWDGRSSLVQSTGPGGTWQETASQEARVHGVMRSADPAPGTERAGAQIQHIFELVPTIPLGLPERISSPTANTFSQGIGLGM